MFIGIGFCAYLKGGEIQMKKLIVKLSLSAMLLGSAFAALPQEDVKAEELQPVKTMSIQSDPGGGGR